MPIPIICVVNGIAINVRFEIALAADIVLVTKNAVFIDTHMDIGLLPSWGLSTKLPRAVGLQREVGERFRRSDERGRRGSFRIGTSEGI